MIWWPKYVRQKAMIVRRRGGYSIKLYL